MTNTVCNLILSILETQDPKFVNSKLEIIEAQIALNEVEKKIIKDVRNASLLNTVPSVSFIREKYAYYTEVDKNIIPAYLSRDSIDSAISDIQVQQAKIALSRDMLDFGGKVQTLTPKEIRERFSGLQSNALIESRGISLENRLRKKESAYKSMVELTDGMSLCIPKVEEYAGKAPKGNVISILAFTGGFKSTYALNIAYANTLLGFNVLYLSLESTADELISRLVVKHIAVNAKSREEAINNVYVRDRKLSKVQQATYDEAHNDLADKMDNHLIMWDSADIQYDTFLDMQNTLRSADKMFKDSTGRGVDAVVLDQLSLLKYTAGSGRRATYDGAILNDWVSFFRKQALDFLDESRLITVFMVAQTSRESFSEASKPKKKGRYESSCASDSHELERATLTMITLFKDWETKNTILVNIPKARQGVVPDHPLQVEVYGEYSHIGPLNFSNSSINAEDFENGEFDLTDLL